MFLVMRTHTVSHTSTQVLWRVESKPFDTYLQAQNWKEFCESEYREENPKGPHKFFVVETDFQGTIP